MIYFLRHGESVANVRYMFAGQRDDSPLTSRGERQAFGAAQELLASRRRIDCIVTSPLRRAKRTAQIVAEVLGFDVASIVEDDRISEYDMGGLSGTTTRRVTSAELVDAHGAESPNAFQRRVMGLVLERAKLNVNTLLVSHMGVGQVIETYRRRADPVHFFDYPAYPNAHIVELQIVQEQR
jgi:uncharacterized phosphatase